MCDALSTAKEITIAAISSKYGMPDPQETAEKTGEWAGKVFQTVIKNVVEGINEANK